MATNGSLLEICVGQVWVVEHAADHDPHYYLVTKADGDHFKVVALNDNYVTKAGEEREVTPRWFDPELCASLFA